MQTLIISILVGWAFDRAQMIISAKNYGTAFNGFGSIDIVNNKTAKAPMSYRVLVPVIVGTIEKVFKTSPAQRLTIYQSLKLLFVILAFQSVSYAWGLPVALLTFLLILATIEYDYWDWTIELAAISLAMSGNLTLALIAGFLFALSRETALILPAVYYMAAKDVIGSGAVMAVTWGAWGLVRLIVGKRELYCKRVMIFENWQAIKEIKKWVPVFYSMIIVSLVITILTIISVFQFPSGWPIPLLLLAAGWILAKANEPRVFAACLPWIAAYLIGGM